MYLSSKFRYLSSNFMCFYLHLNWHVDNHLNWDVDIHKSWAVDQHLKSGVDKHLKSGENTYLHWDALTYLHRPHDSGPIQWARGDVVNPPPPRAHGLALTASGTRRLRGLPRAQIHQNFPFLIGTYPGGARQLRRGSTNWHNQTNSRIH